MTTLEKLIEKFEFLANMQDKPLTCSPNHFVEWIKDLKEVQRQMNAILNERHHHEQMIGQAIGMPWYVDYPENFPDATKDDGVCVGELVLEDLINILLPYYKCGYVKTKSQGHPESSS